MKTNKWLSEAEVTSAWLLILQRLACHKGHCATARTLSKGFPAFVGLPDQAHLRVRVAFSTRSDRARSLADDTKAVWGLIASQVLHCTVVPEVI